MSELAELEKRITDALDRIGGGLDRLAAPPPAPGPGDSVEVTELNEALEAEKTAVAQLEERLKTLRGQNEARIKELETEASALKARAEEAEQKLGQAQQELQAAQAEGAGADALRQELQGLRKIRDTDRAELDDILASLKPLMEDQTHA